MDPHFNVRTPRAFTGSSHAEGPRKVAGRLLAASALTLCLAGCQALEWSEHTQLRYAKPIGVKPSPPAIVAPAPPVLRPAFQPVFRPAYRTAFLTAPGYVQDYARSPALAGLRAVPADRAMFFHRPAPITAPATGLRAAPSYRTPAYKLPTRVAVDRTLDNGVRVFRPGASGPVRVIKRPGIRSVPRSAPQTVPQPQAPAPRPAPQAALPAAPRVPAPPVRAPQTSAPPADQDPVSYVRVNGTLSVEDWTACERSTGGAFIVAPGSTRLAPDFDACMRARGYLPETEAAEQLALER